MLSLRSLRWLSLLVLRRGFLFGLLMLRPIRSVIRSLWAIAVLFGISANLLRRLFLRILSSLLLHWRSLLLLLLRCPLIIRNDFSAEWLVGANSPTSHEALYILFIYKRGLSYIIQSLGFLEILSFRRRLCFLVFAGLVWICLWVL
jgi:hypothetical protein